MRKRLLALATARAAMVDVDDVRQLIVSGGAASWQGPDGLAQRLGVENACSLASNFHAAGFDVILADVLTPVTLELYRQRFLGCLIVRLDVSDQEARRRAATRTVYLTDAKFTQPYDQDRDDPPPADYDLDITDLTIEQQVAAVTVLWRNTS